MTCYNPNACRKSPDPRGKACRSCTSKAYGEKRIGWCPEERRDEYRKLVKNYRMTAVEARQAIMGEV